MYDSKRDHLLFSVNGQVSSNRRTCELMLLFRNYLPTNTLGVTLVLIISVWGRIASTISVLKHGACMLWHLIAAASSHRMPGFWHNVFSWPEVIRSLIYVQQCSVACLFLITRYWVSPCGNLSVCLECQKHLQSMIKEAKGICIKSNQLLVLVILHIVLASSY